MVPLLARFAVLYESDSAEPLITYDTCTESLAYDKDSNDLAIWLTGSTMTKATGDPTHDEASDR